MRKIISIAFAIFVCVAIQAQNHMKFMGIPLDGTVESFSQKLKAKGVTYDADASRKLSPGSKLYKGTFMGEKANFLVMFNAKSRIVYGVGVELSYSSVELAQTPFMNMSEQLHKKYPTAKFDRIEDSEKDAIGVSFTIPEEDSSQMLGIINQTLGKPDGALKTYWSINLIYVDVKNLKKNDEINNEDL